MAGAHKRICPVEFGSVAATLQCTNSNLAVLRSLDSIHMRKKKVCFLTYRDCHKTYVLWKNVELKTAPKKYIHYGIKKPSVCYHFFTVAKNLS